MGKPFTWLQVQGLLPRDGEEVGAAPRPLSTCAGPVPRGSLLLLEGQHTLTTALLGMRSSEPAPAIEFGPTIPFGHLSISGPITGFGPDTQTNTWFHSYTPFLLYFTAVCCEHRVIHSGPWSAIMLPSDSLVSGSGPSLGLVRRHKDSYTIP